MNEAFSTASKAMVQPFCRPRRFLDGVKMMKTLTTSMLLSVIFLSAGAFAGPDHDTLRAPAAPAASENVTVIAKTGVWPPAAQVSMEPCKIRRCLDI
jgi:hypothetical protein